jgi:hypothetical protein
MSQRNSGYDRVGDENYETIAWPIAALFLHLDGVRLAWDPANRGSGRLITTLRALGVAATGTTQDFFTITAAPVGTDLLCTNPPYGENKRGELAVAFISHALTLLVGRIAMLLRNDFDSAITRRDLFRHNPTFAGKVILLNRIKWFVGPSSPSDNHSWFCWDRAHVGPPAIRYATRDEAEALLVTRITTARLLRAGAR